MRCCGGCLAFFFLPFISSWQVNTVENMIVTRNLDILKDDSIISRNIFDFSLRLQNALIENSAQENVVLSPASVAGVMAMALLGSVGNTYEEIALTLGFSQDVRRNIDYHKLLGHQLNLLSQSNTTSKTGFANAIFVDKTVAIRKPYQRFLEGVYNSTVLSSDFAKADESMEQINSWVRDHTNGGILQMLSQPLAPETKVVLGSAIYFNGEWAHPFLPVNTRNFSFLTEDNREIETTMMVTGGMFKFAKSFRLGCELLAMPYADNRTVLYALKPMSYKNKDIKQLLQELNASTIEYLIDMADTRNVIVRFPKTTLERKVDLRDVLKKVGVATMFSPGAANFALMIEKVASEKESDLREQLLFRLKDDERALKDGLDSLPNPGVHVDSVIHQAKIKFDEFGTEASAATLGLVGRSGEKFYVDSPFFLFIRDEASKQVTFTAVVLDPTR